MCIRDSNGHTYTLSDVAFHGKGTAEVNADVQNHATDTALAVEDAKVTVNGDVKTDENGGGVGALGTADVTVNGNVYGTLGGVAATEESKITVNGDVDSDGVGALATDKGEAVVNGDVKGGEVGVAAEGESTVKVEGDVAGKDLSLIHISSRCCASCPAYAPTTTSPARYRACLLYKSRCV